VSHEQKKKRPNGRRGPRCWSPRVCSTDLVSPIHQATSLQVQCHTDDRRALEVAVELSVHLRTRYA
jgi:hypothetical protein